MWGRGVARGAGTGVNVGRKPWRVAGRLLGATRPNALCAPSPLRAPASPRRYAAGGTPPVRSRPKLPYDDVWEVVREAAMHVRGIAAPSCVEWYSAGFTGAGGGTVIHA